MADRRCPDCGHPIKPPARVCVDDRARRRALTFTSQAVRIADELPGRRYLAAREHLNAALGELERPHSEPAPRS